MLSNLRVTDQPQESCFFDIVNGDSVISIPLFQRRYRWKKKSLDLLFDDILQVRDGAADSYFLGIIVSINRIAVPGRPVPFDIVDGQQRLTTLYLILLATVQWLAENGHPDRAANILGTYLLVRPLADNPVNTKLLPSFPDRAQFASIWKRVMDAPGLATIASVAANPPAPPPSSGEAAGDMTAQYGRIYRRLTQMFTDGTVAPVEQLVEIIANRLSVVAISLRDPGAAPTIFERLNNRAELVTVADLVRNEVFVRAPADPAEVQHIFTTKWEPFAQQFTPDANLEQFLFPYALIEKPATKKTDVFAELRQRWANLDPASIIVDMQRFVPGFLALESGKYGGASPSLAPALKRIHQLGKPSSTYPFIMRLIVAVDAGDLSSDVATEVLACIESFLFRRAVCGIEPTGLHAVFKGMWRDLSAPTGPGITVSSVIGYIRAKPTIPWPDDAAFERQVREGNLYLRKVVKFALREFELGSPGETPMDDFWVEHILPQSATSEWESIFGDEAAQFLHTWANLIPLTEAMNPAVGRQGFTQKRAEYARSIFSTPRDVASRFDAWTPDTLRQRAAEIANWAKARWPHTAAGAAVA